MINRRNFLKVSAASTLTGAGALDLSQSSAFAATTPTDFKTIVCVFMDGGNDSFNMLMPNTTAEYNAYAQSRQGLAIERSALQAISPKGLGANSFGLHPNMPELKNIFNDGDASLIANVGPLIEPTNKSDIINGSARLPSRLGSHSEGKSYWKGDHDDSSSSSQDGIAGRLANEFVNGSRLPMLMSVNLGARHELFLNHADVPVYGVAGGGLVKIQDYNLALTGPNSRPPAIARRAALDKLNMLGMQEENLFLRHSGKLLSNGIDLSLIAQEFLEDVPSLNDDFPEGVLSRDLQRAAEMISIRERLGMRRQIIYVQVNGFDTHGGLVEFHSSAMENLSKSLAAFNQVMKKLDVHSSVLTYTASDFGRTLTNTGDGTDHAWGSNQILMGGGIKGGELFGSFPALELDGIEDYNGDGRMIPSTSVTQHAATIARWFGVPQNRLSVVVPNIVNFSGREDLGFFA